MFILLSVILEYHVALTFCGYKISQIFPAKYLRIKNLQNDLYLLIEHVVAKKFSMVANFNPPQN